MILSVTGRSWRQDLCTFCYHHRNSPQHVELQVRRRQQIHPVQWASSALSRENIQLPLVSPLPLSLHSNHYWVLVSWEMPSNVHLNEEIYSFLMVKTWPGMTPRPVKKWYCPVKGSMKYQLWACHVTGWSSEIMVAGSPPASSDQLGHCTWPFPGPW